MLHCVRASFLKLVKRPNIVQFNYGHLAVVRPVLYRFSNRRWYSEKVNLPKPNIVDNTGRSSVGDLENSSDYLHIQNILLQKNQQRITKQKLLNEASGFYERFKISTKWFLIRENRPFNGEEISTLFSWLILSQVVWVILGTTTFVSLLLFTANTVFAKEIVGKLVGNCLNKYIEGVDVEFQDALVPEWKKGNISFQKVKIKTTDNDGFNKRTNQLISFDLSFNRINLTLSVRKWLRGQGLIQNLYISGMKGDVSIQKEQKDYRLIDWFSNPNYELGEVQVDDSCISFSDVENDQKFRLSIYNMQMSQLRLQWCLPDIFNADVVSGAINHSLFSIHKRQPKLCYLNDFENDLSPWERITRLRLNPISVRDLGLDKSNAFNWIQGGQVEIIADLMLPKKYSEPSKFEEDNKYVVMDLKFTFRDLAARMGEVTPKLSDNKELLSFDELRPIIAFINTQRGAFHSIRDFDSSNPVWPTKVSIDKKSYPDKTVISSGAATWPEGEKMIQLNREIIKYHDHPSSKDNELVLTGRIVKDINDLKNMFLFKETGVYDQLTMELYADLMKMIEETEYKKKNDWVKLWGTTVASQILIFGLGAIV
ncbi:Mdm32p Ecym_4551 [Eremothecium cymbalariae DBVPG|uniref:Mitochondrial distribution and morphology protein 32 n=1 Tax=Eremothecium cymbalariae (strain CBS 270.75 / DBVPG 7215 / KCTC 17166 / NRRL Y-17582) TaxID=931890 RepID=G8JU83_ERECY|nr:hypothetical protein Ecym_4551 [Eremothecium cymbalariae DBVPG\